MQTPAPVKHVTCDLGHVQRALSWVETEDGWDLMVSPAPGSVRDCLEEIRQRVPLAFACTHSHPHT